MARVEGMDKLKRKLKRLPKDVEKAIQPALEKSGNELAGMMKRLVPVDEGDLRDSITVTKSGESTPPHSQPGGQRTAKENEVLVTAGDTDARYAHLVEFGTSHAPAQPYFWVSFRLLRKRLDSRIKRELGKAVKDSFDGR